MCPRTAFSGEWESGDMSLSLYERISNHFHLVHDIHLQGWGEPLLHPKLFDMIKIAKAEKCRVSLTTNGVLLSRNISERLIRDGVDIVAVSFAGASKDIHERIRCGSHFEQVIKNVRTMSDLKTKMRSKTPKLELSFLMTKTSMEELPEAVGLANDAGVNELVATNLDYTPTQNQDDLKAFSCSRADGNFRKLVEMAKKRAEKTGLPFRVYPLEMDEAIMCELNPLQIVFISYDGCVSPCVYLNMTKRMSIPRIFCGSHQEIQRVCFGAITENDFPEIWNKKEYKEFRTAYDKRIKLLEKSNASVIFQPMDLEKVEEEIRKGLSGNPLPDVCKTCYKAYGI
jgi:MoaA/NifB/PqqE/SkfB family radical SAM enzyme